MPITIRQAKKSDFDKVHELTSYCYGFDPVSSRERMERRWLLTFQENFVVELGSQILANARLINYEQNIRGVWKKMAGIGMVVSEPTMRRKGYVRELMHYLLQKMQEEGVAVSCLYPFKDTFYSAFNYVNISANQFLLFNPRFLSRWKKLPEGYSIKRLPHIEGFPILKSLHEKAMAKIHGGVKRDEHLWTTLNVPNRLSYIVCYNSEGIAEGILRTIPRGFSEGFDWVETGRLEILDFYVLSVKAKHALFTFLYHHSDQIKEIILPLNPQESELYPWLNEYYMVQVKTRNLWQARIINIQKALQNLPVTTTGELSIKVNDSLLPSNNQNYSIKNQKGQLEVQTIKEEQVDFELTIEGLTALVYGSLEPFELEEFGWLEIHNPKKVPLLMQWFPRIHSYMLEDF